MEIVYPNISQNDFDYAIECLEACKQEHAEQYGFRHPYFTPGGQYGKQWWQLDSALALCGYKWIDRHFAETALLNFIESQKSDGRICLWGADVLPNTVAGNNSLCQTKNISSLPKLFDVSYHIVQGSNDLDLKTATYNMLKNYLNWWFINRQDEKTGLITAVFEETFIPYLGFSEEYAPVDTNVEIYVGCHYTQLLAIELGKTADAEDLEYRKHNLKQSINQYLWNKEKGSYFAYFVKERRQSDRLMASTFYPLRMEIANFDQRKSLIKLLKNQAHFNWNAIPLTSVSMKDDAFITTKGEYQGNASWSGNVWTLINEMVIRGLIDSKENELAAELAVKTLSAFNHNCTEFINPFDGSGHGVIQYAWTASQYLELIIETIFGISYQAKDQTIILSPKLTTELKNSYLELKDIHISNDVYLNVKIDHGNISYSISENSIKINIEILP